MKENARHAPGRLQCWHVIMALYECGIAAEASADFERCYGAREMDPGLTVHAQRIDDGRWLVAVGRAGGSMAGFTTASAADLIGKLNGMLQRATPAC